MKRELALYSSDNLLIEHPQTQQTRKEIETWKKRNPKRKRKKKEKRAKRKRSSTLNTIAPNPPFFYTPSKLDNTPQHTITEN